MRLYLMVQQKNAVGGGENFHFSFFFKTTKRKSSFWLIFSEKMSLSLCWKSNTCGFSLRCCCSSTIPKFFRHFWPRERWFLYLDWTHTHAYNVASLLVSLYRAGRPFIFLYAFSTLAPKESLDLEVLGVANRLIDVKKKMRVDLHVSCPLHTTQIVRRTYARRA